MRDITRKIPDPDIELRNLLSLAKRILQQKRDNRNKLYSLHAPEVECIAKGKSKAKYEFGCKVAVTTTGKESWVISIFAAHDNPYDGHALEKNIRQSEQLTQIRIKDVFVDRGYRGKENHPKDTNIFISGAKRIPVTLKKLLRARAGIEPIIGHLKEDHRLDKNYLLGEIGDKVNAVLRREVKVRVFTLLFVCQDGSSPCCRC
jgi:IS5 family transposase